MDADTGKKRVGVVEAGILWFSDSLSVFLEIPDVVQCNCGINVAQCAVYSEYMPNYTVSIILTNPF